MMLFKHIKKIGIGVIVLDLLYLILAIIYFPLTVKGVLPSGIWFVIISSILLLVNVLFVVLLLVLKNKDK